MTHDVRSAPPPPTDEPGGRLAPGPPAPTLVLVAVVLGAVVLGVLSALSPVLALAAGGLLAVTFVVLSRPVLAVLVVVAVVPVVSGVQRGVPVPSLRLSEAITMVVLGGVLLTSWRGWRPRWSALEWATLVYSVATVVLVPVGAVRRGGQLDLLLILTLLLPVQFLLLSRVTSFTLVTERLRRAAIRALLFASVPVSTLTFLQYLEIQPVTGWIVTMTGSDNIGEAVEMGFAARATGPFDHWHVLAGYLFPIVLVTVALLLDHGQRVMSRAGLRCILVVDLVALVLTFTFTAAFGIIGGVAVIAIRSKRVATLLRGGAVLTVVVVGLLAPLIGERVSEQFQPRPGQAGTTLVPETLDYRLEVWRDQYLPVVAESPLLGYGVEVPGTITWVYSESFYLSLQLRGGALLVLAFGALVWAFLASMAAPSRSPDATVRVPAQVVIASTLVLIPMHAVFPYFASPGLPQLLWLLAGVALAGRWSAARSTRDSRDPDGDRGLGDQDPAVTG